MSKQVLKTHSLEEITAKHIGKRGTPKREAFEQELRTCQQLLYAARLIPPEDWDCLNLQHGPSRFGRQPDGDCKAPQARSNVNLPA